MNNSNETSTIEDNYYNLQCNYGKGNEQTTIISKISHEDKEYILNLTKSWYFWKGGNCIKNPGGYIRSHINKESVYLHHIIMERMGIPKPDFGYSIDHINRDKLDNRRENLRWATQSVQNSNTSKRQRKQNARALPDGITQDMLPKYVVYYKECLNKEKDLYREFFKIESHPKFEKPIMSSKSIKISIQDKLKEIKEKLAEIDKDDSEKCKKNENSADDDDDEIVKLMKTRPVGIQYNKETDKRGSKYVISRRFTPEGVSDISSSGRKDISDREKFIEIYEKYKQLDIYKNRIRFS
tara:strand:- start:3749 stop:4636 length:888 start_codon:yes stop_codon:yes gene_type:complete